MSLTEQDWLKNLGIKVVIISRGRAENVVTSKLLPNYIEIVVPSSQADDYRKNNPNPVVEIPDECLGLGKTRNWCLDNFKEETVIMCDDDIHAVYDITGFEAERLSPEAVVQAIISLTVVARDMGVHWFGYSIDSIKYFSPQEPFLFVRSPSAIVGMNGRNYRFRDDKYKVDFDMTLQNLLVDRICLVDKRTQVINKMMLGKGGNTTDRTMEKFKESLDSLTDRWGKYIKVDTKKNHNDISLSIKVTRRQKI